MQIKLYDPLGNSHGTAKVRDTRAFPHLIYVEKRERGNLIPIYYIQKTLSPTCDEYVQVPLERGELESTTDATQYFSKLLQGQHTDPR